MAPNTIISAESGSDRLTKVLELVPGKTKATEVYHRNMNTKAIKSDHWKINPKATKVDFGKTIPRDTKVLKADHGKEKATDVFVLTLIQPRAMVGKKTSTPRAREKKSLLNSRHHPPLISPLMDAVLGKAETQNMMV